MPGTALVDALLKVQKSEVFYTCKSTLSLKVHQFYSAKIYLKTWHKARKPLVSQLATTKSLKKTKIEENFLCIFFNEVSGMSRSAESLKESSMLANRFISSKN